MLRGGEKDVFQLLIRIRYKWDPRRPFIWSPDPPVIIRGAKRTLYNLRKIGCLKDTPLKLWTPRDAFGNPCVLRHPCATKSGTPVENRIPALAK